MRNYANDFTEPITPMIAAGAAGAATDTEPIFARLDGYRSELARHPFLRAARRHELSTEILLELAFHQYSDSILWIPMLAQMKGRAVRSARLRRAIEENIAHEAGLGSTSHVQLAAAMMRSLGVASLAPFPTATFAESATLWLTDGFADASEPSVAGWLLVAETLVPQLFAAVAPCYARLAGCDTRYFDEHVAVDTDEHAAWMAESVADVLAIYGPGCMGEILEGMEDAWQEARQVPDALWGR
jgi:pyrroloquinoline quinone (PQQ) biosynthesis protein C